MSKCDLHIHSRYSSRSEEWLFRRLDFPDSYSDPRELHRQLIERGMDFVTITDHDTIDGVLEIADEPSVFVSEELTAWFRGEPQAVHVLCFGITSDDHKWLQANSADVVACAEYLHSQEIACALAHPFFSVAAPLTPAHRRVLAELFPVWEVRNGMRPKELNGPPPFTSRHKASRASLARTTTPESTSAARSPRRRARLRRMSFSPTSAPDEWRHAERREAPQNGRTAR